MRNAPYAPSSRSSAGTRSLCPRRRTPAPPSSPPRATCPGRSRRTEPGAGGPRRTSEDLLAVLRTLHEEARVNHRRVRARRPVAPAQHAERELGLVHHRRDVKLRRAHAREEVPGLELVRRRRGNRGGRRRRVHAGGGGYGARTREEGEDAGSDRGGEGACAASDETRPGHEAHREGARKGTRGAVGCACGSGRREAGANPPPPANSSGAQVSHRPAGGTRRAPAGLWRSRRSTSPSSNEIRR